MRMMVRALFCAMAAAGAAPALAEPVLFHCKLKVARNEGWVPGEVAIVYDAATQSVTVSDPFQQHYFGKPAEGQLIVDNEKRVTFGWDLPRLKNAEKQYTPDMKYRATVQKAGLAVAISATPVGYPNHFRGDGSCKMEKVKRRG